MNKKPRVLQRQAAVNGSRFSRPLHPVIEKILCARGVTDDASLELSFARLARPDQLAGIDAATQLLAQAVQQGQSVLVVGDFDADGATGTALAVGLLRAMGATRVDFAVPNRFEFGYGLTPGLVATLADNPPDLLITVDSGIACLEGVRCARELGICVIVTDHHLPGEQLPAAHAIVNPNCAGDGFPSKSLAGVGVVFYLLSSLRAQLRSLGWFGPDRPEPKLADWLDLVALGTVADVVALDYNNRVLVSQGLKRIRAGRCRPGLLALLKLARRDYRQAVAADLGFAIGPRLNAAGRLEDMSVGIRCLLSDDREQAEVLAQRLDQLNHERRQLQAQMTEDAQQQVDRLLEALDEEPRFSHCLFDDQWHQGIVGLVASRIKDRCHRPVVVFAPENEGSGTLKGSARSIRGLHIRDVLAHVDASNPGLIQAFGGHAMAAGLTLQHEALGPFAQALEASVQLFLDDQLPEKALFSDGTLGASELNLEFAQQLRELGPWGQKFPEPLFEGHFDIVDQRVVGGAHLKLVLKPVDESQTIDAIAFGTLPEQLGGARTVYGLYRLDVNHFRGRSSVQLMMEHISAA